VEASIELTRARVDDGPSWWTICVETEGAPDALDAPLVPAARHFFADFPAASCPLDVDASFGYAAWLCRMDRPAAPAQRGAQRRAFLATDSREHLQACPPTAARSPSFRVSDLLSETFILVFRISIPRRATFTRAEEDAPPERAGRNLLDWPDSMSGPSQAKST
jgi:hypothetical protein